VAVGATTVACGTLAKPHTVGETALDTKGYERAYADAGGLAGIGRPATPVEKWGTGCGQLFSGGQSRTAALLQWPCGANEQVFAVTGDFWDLYRARGDIAPATYGFPLGSRGEWNGGFTQGFGREGGVEHFFMQRPGHEPHVLSSPLLDYYLSFDDRGARFGYPTSDEVTAADGRRCQAFERGVLTERDDGTELTFGVSTAGCPAP
jgi:hypothetical protein